MGKRRYDDDVESTAKRKSPAVLLAQILGLVAAIGAVLAVVWYILARGGAFDPSPRERLVKNLPRLKPGMRPTEVKHLFGDPRAKNPKEFVALLTRRDFERDRLLLTEPPSFGAGGREWLVPPNRTMKFAYLDESGGHLKSFEAALTFKDGRWGVTITDTSKPPPPPVPPKGTPPKGPPLKGPPLKGAPPKGQQPKGMGPPGQDNAPFQPPNAVPLSSLKTTEHWLYYHQAIRRPKSEDGPIDLIVVLTFEDGGLAYALRGDIDLKGLPKPGGGTF